MANNIYKQENRTEILRKTVIFYIITAIVALIIGLLIATFLFKNNAPNNEVSTLTQDDIRTNSSDFDTTIEKQEIDSLIKSYITASVLGEKEILLALTTDTFNSELQNKTIEKQNDIKFYSNTLTVDTISLSEYEGIFNVKYVLEYQGQTIQQNHKIYTIKENNRWKISNLVNE